MAPQREWFEKDYYKLLGVSDTATAKEIKSAYRKLSRQFHPDNNPGDKAAEDKFKEISEAHDVIGRGRAGGREPRGAGPQRGADLETELQLSFLGAVQGVTTTVNLTSEVACHNCHGTGAKPGTTPRQCPRCAGRGVLD